MSIRDRIGGAVRQNLQVWQEWNASNLIPADEIPGWQPIETAPRDGTWILARGMWARKRYTQAIRFTAGNVGDWTSLYGATIRPTHWMPLPDPPKDA